MNQIPENQQPQYESDVEQLLQIARDQFAGDFVTGVHFMFGGPELTDLAEVQIYPCFGYKNEARANLRAQFQAGRVCTGGRLMIFYDVPWHDFTFPAYREALLMHRTRRSGGSDVQ